MLYPPGFYYVKKPKRFVILSSDKSSERNLSCFFEIIIKPRRMEHLQSEEPFSSDPYFNKIFTSVDTAETFYNPVDFICYQQVTTNFNFCLGKTLYDVILKVQSSLLIHKVVLILKKTNFLKASKFQNVLLVSPNRPKTNKIFEGFLPYPSH